MQAAQEHVRRNRAGVQFNANLTLEVAFSVSVRSSLWRVVECKATMGHGSFRLSALHDISSPATVPTWIDGTWALTQRNPTGHHLRPHHIDLPDRQARSVTSIYVR